MDEAVSTRKWDPVAAFNWFLVFLAIILIGAVVIPTHSVSGDVPKTRVNISCAKQLGLGLLMFANDNDDFLPKSKDAILVEKALGRYVKSDALWNTVDPAGGRFHFNARLSGRRLAKIPHPERTVLIYSDLPDATGQWAICFVDGHARRVSETEWQGLLSLK